MIKVKTTTVRRTRRTDAILYLRQTYDGDIAKSPHTYNQAFAAVLHRLADAVAQVKDAWVDPGVTVWMHEDGVITAEVPLSPKK